MVREMCVCESMFTLYSAIVGKLQSIGYTMFYRPVEGRNISTVMNRSRR